MPAGLALRRTEARARCLLDRERARIVDRLVEESVVDGVQVKIDPGSKETGVVLVRTDDDGTHALKWRDILGEP